MLRLTATSRGTSLELSVAAAPEARAPDELEGCTRAGLERDVGGGEPLGMGDLQAPRSGGPELVTLAAGAAIFWNCCLCWASASAEAASLAALSCAT